MSDRLSAIRERLERATKKDWGACYPFPVNDIRYLLSIAEAAAAYREKCALWDSEEYKPTLKEMEADRDEQERRQSRLFAALDEKEPSNV